MITISRCSINNLDELVPLFDAYRQFYEQPSDLDAARHFLADRLSKEQSVILMAHTHEGRPAGFTQLYPMFSSVRMAPIWILNDLFVAPDARKKGVARHLMDAANHWARESGAAALELATARDNTPAKRLYESLNWELDTTYDHYYLRLP